MGTHMATQTPTMRAQYVGSPLARNGATEDNRVEKEESGRKIRAGNTWLTAID